MNDKKYLKKCKYCKEILVRDEKTKRLICPSKECREKGKKKKENSKNFPPRKNEKKQEDEKISKEIFENIRTHSQIREYQRTIKNIKTKSNICRKCGGTIRKNYPFGKSSKARIVGHSPNCEILKNKNGNRRR